MSTPDDALIDELKAECRRLREQLAAMATKLMIEGSHSQHRFEVISMDDHGRQRSHRVRDVYYHDASDQWANTRIIISL